jgi:hypothetical protein
MSDDKTHFISASLDKTAKIFDSTTLVGLYKLRIQLTHSLKPPGCSP